jgi:hypothetical protein
MSSVGYWYAERPTAVATPPPVGKRMPVLRDNKGGWLYDRKGQITPYKAIPTAEMKALKARWKRTHGK